MQFGPPWSALLAPKRPLTITAQHCPLLIKQASLTEQRGVELSSNTLVRVRFQDFFAPAGAPQEAFVCSLVTKHCEQAVFEILILKGHSIIVDTGGDENWVSLMGHYLIDDINSSAATTAQPGETVPSTDGANRKRPRTQSRAKAAASPAATPQHSGGAKTALAQEPTSVSSRSSTPKPVTRRNSAKSVAAVNVASATYAVVLVGAQQPLPATVSHGTKDLHASVPVTGPVGDEKIAVRSPASTLSGVTGDQDAADRAHAAHGKARATPSTSEDSSVTMLDLPDPVADVITEDIKVGSDVGPSVDTGDTVTINFRTRVKDAEYHDSNLDGYTFTVGDNSVIQGVSKGLLGMRVGGERVILIPPNLGYGSRGSGTSVPPNAIIHYECQLVSIDHQAPKHRGA